MNNQLQDWIQAGRWQQAVMWLENEILQGRDIEEKPVSLLPHACLQASPLLLKARAEHHYRGGRLLEAKHDLAAAVKGFASQSFRRPLLSAMGLWADVLLRTGELNWAQTLLQFLMKEYDDIEGKAEAASEVPYALSRGARLLPESVHAHTMLVAAFECYSRESRTGQAVVAIELLLQEDGERDHSLETSLLMHLQKLAAAHGDFGPYLLFAQAISLIRQKEWKEAAVRLQEVPLTQLPYNLAAAAELQLVRALQHSDQAAYSGQLGRLQRLQDSFACDWELQLAVRRAKLDWHRTYGSPEEAEQTKRELTVIGSMLQLGEEPEEQAAADRDNSTVSAGPEVGNGHAPVITSAVSSAEPWRIQCMGGLKLIGKAAQIAHIPWKRKKAKELFLYLLLEPHYSAGKEQMAELLLPGSEPERAVKHLYVIIHQLKKALQSSLHIENGIVIREDQIRLNESMIEFVDVEQYLSLIRVADQLWVQDRELSLELYTKAHLLYGPLLPELPYLDWLEQRRGHLQEKQTALLHRLGRAASDAGHFDQAHLYFLEWIELRPYQEEAYQEMMRLLVGVGRHQEAERWYSKLAEVCRTELLTEPSAETRLILSQGIG